MIAVIGGSGVYNPDFLTNLQQDSISTPYGSVTYNSGMLQGQPIYFLARHGGGHSIPPHLINYRANIWALKKLGVQKIFATAAVGSLQERIFPGNFVVVDDFLDFTNGRAHTFFEGGAKSSVLHIDATAPYCNDLRNILIKNLTQAQQTHYTTGTYVCTQGPRYESRHEVRMFAQLGGAVIGMTGMPECILAHEAEMCYATICLVTNHAAGIADHPLTFEEVRVTMKQQSSVLQKILMNSVVDAYQSTSTCNCANMAYEVGGFKI